MKLRRLVLRKLSQFFVDLYLDTVKLVTNGEEVTIFCLTYWYRHFASSNPYSIIPFLILVYRITTTLKKKKSPGQILLPGINITLGRKDFKPSDFNCPCMCRYVRFYICKHIENHKSHFTFRIELPLGKKYKTFFNKFKGFIYTWDIFAYWCLCTFTSRYSCKSFTLFWGLTQSPLQLGGFFPLTPRTLAESFLI